MNIKNTALLILAFASIFCYAENTEKKLQKRVDGVLKSMSLEEKVGQMFMPAVFVTSKKDSIAAVEMIKKYHLGGVSLYKNDIEPLVDFINVVNKESKIAPFVAMTFERGMAMRIAQAFNYPWNMTLGALENDSLIVAMGERVGEACVRIGVNFNFAPTADVNTNSANPIIGLRSFGSDAELVARKSIAYIKGLESTGVLSSVKHYPGHGDTSLDSHKALPVLNHSKVRMNDVELLPFEKTLKNGASSIMVGHLSVPAMEGDGALPSSLSKKVVSDMIRGRWNYLGLIVTDALNMKGVSDHYPSGVAEVMAVEAGADLLLYSDNLDKAYKAVLEKAKSDKKFAQRVDQSVERILRAKLSRFADKVVVIDKENIVMDINTERDSIIHLQIMEQAMTLLKNENKTLPVIGLEDKEVFLVGFGEGDHQVFERYLSVYQKVSVVDRNLSAEDILSLLPEGAVLVVSYHTGDEAGFRADGMPEQTRNKIKTLGAAKNSVLVMFDSPYQLLDEKIYGGYKAILLGYQNSWAAQMAGTQVIFGGIGAKGKLPVDISPKYKQGHGIKTKAIDNLNFGFATQGGISAEKMAVVDSLLADIVSVGAAPGGRMIVARKGQIVVDKCFGTTMYGDSLSVAVSPNTVYDLASVSKVSATLPMIMKLYEDDKIELSATLSDLLKEYRGSNKESVRLDEILTHCGGLPGGLGFYNWTIDPKTKRPSEFFYSGVCSDDFPLRVGTDVWMRRDYGDTVTSRIYASRMLKKERRYSDLDFYLLRDIVDRYYEDGIERGVQKEFYAPMGAWTMGFLPLKRVEKGLIAPTMNDTWFRNELVQGFVHDGGAAMYGGVSGHAGNFASGYDLTKYAQMLLQGGHYGGHRFLEERTVKKFTSYYQGIDEGRQSLGFVKRSMEEDEYDSFLSKQAFWHTGWTGTLMLVEPKYDLVYVLLTNRTYQEKKAGLLSENSYRFKILKAIIESIEEQEDGN